MASWRGLADLGVLGDLGQVELVEVRHMRAR
jgi:hypothetical protein